MKTRIFRKEDGSVVYDSPSAKYQGGHFVDQLDKPLFQVTEDPIIGEDGEPTGQVTETKKLIGYEKRELTLDDCKIPEGLQSLPFVVVDLADAPKSDSNTGDYHEMIHFDGDCHKDNLKQDKEWNCVLMPDFLIKQKRLASKAALLDAELEKQEPDPVQVVKLQREIEKTKECNCPIKHKEWALEGLDSRVAKGESDKPVVRQKLLNKKAELENA